MRLIAIRWGRLFLELVVARLLRDRRQRREICRRIGRGLSPDKFGQLVDQGIRFFQLALPNREDIPPQQAELPLILLVALNCPLEFRHPVVLAAGGRAVPRATGVPVPKTTVNENHGVVFWQHNIWLARQGSVVQAKPEAPPVQQRAQGLLRQRVLATDKPHDFTSFFWRYGVQCNSSTRLVSQGSGHKPACERPPMLIIPRRNVNRPRAAPPALD